MRKSFRLIGFQTIPVPVSRGGLFEHPSDVAVFPEPGSGAVVMACVALATTMTRRRRHEAETVGTPTARLTD